LSISFFVRKPFFFLSCCLTSNFSVFLLFCLLVYLVFVVSSFCIFAVVSFSIVYTLSVCLFFLLCFHLPILLFVCLSCCASVCSTESHINTMDGLGITLKCVLSWFWKLVKKEQNLWQTIFCSRIIEISFNVRKKKSSQEALIFIQLTTLKIKQLSDWKLLQRPIVHIEHFCAI
jgi:hypothetical protein